MNTDDAVEENETLQMKNKLRKCLLIHVNLLCYGYVTLALLNFVSNLSFIWRVYRVVLTGKYAEFIEVMRVANKWSKSKIIFSTNINPKKMKNSQSRSWIESRTYGMRFVVAHLDKP